MMTDREREILAEYPTASGVIATATVSEPVAADFGGGHVDQHVHVLRYPDGVVRVEVEHYDGYHAIHLSASQWRAFRAAIVADDGT